MLSIVLPSFNEEKNVANTIKEISDFLLGRHIDYEIVAVNDGSRDKTGNVLKECLEEYKKLIVVTHPKNLGYGAALRSGFEKARGDLIFFTDSDRQFDIQDISIFLDKIKEYDFVVGFRKKRQDPFYRLVYAFLFRLIAWVFFGINVKDVDCAFKLFKKEIIKNANLTSEGALINLEIFAHAKKGGFKFVQVPVEHFPRKEGTQTGGNSKVLSRALLGLFFLWKRLYKKEFLEFFSLSGVVLSATFLTYLLSFFAFGVFQNKFLPLGQIWERWDAFNYINIAQNWYQDVGPDRFLIVFLPLYPILIRLFAIIFGNYLVSALIVSNLGYFVAALYLYKLARLDFSRRTAFWSILYFSFFPTAYFLHAPYTEGLFLALVISSFYYARKGNWPVACILCALSGASRLTGLLMVPALLWEYFQQKNYRLANIKKNVFWFLSTPLGFLGYLYINAVVHGNIFAFQQVQNEHFFEHFSWPWFSIKEAIKCSLWRSPSEKLMLCYSEIFFIFFTLFILILGIRRLRFSYSIFAFLSLFLTTSMSLLRSTSRYTLAIFPIFIILGLVADRKNKTAAFIILFFFLSFYTIFLSIFAQGYWAF